MDKGAVALRARLFLAVVTVVAVASAELGLFFCLNARLVVTGLVTVLVLLVIARIATHQIGARGGFLVGFTSLGCIPTALIIGRWEARGVRGAPTSDFEDFSLFVLLLGAFAYAAAFAVRRTRTKFADTLRSSIRRLFAGTLVIAVALVAGAVFRASRGFDAAPGPYHGSSATMIIAGAVGIALAIALGVAARRARAQHEALASGAMGLHRGDGWLEFDDGSPPIHRTHLVGSPSGPVVVLGRTATTNKGYRGMAVADEKLSVTFGTPQSIRDEGTSLATSHHAVAVAALAFAILPLVALVLVGVSPF